MSSVASWIEALTLLALGRHPKPTVEELRAMAGILQAATSDVPDPVVRETVLQLTLHLESNFLPAPAVILAALHERLHPLDLEAVLSTIRRAYYDAELVLTPTTLQRLFPAAEDYAVARALLETVGAHALLNHALAGDLHPIDLRRATEAAQVALSHLPTSPRGPLLPAGLEDVPRLAP